MASPGPDFASEHSDFVFTRASFRERAIVSIELLAHLRFYTILCFFVYTVTLVEADFGVQTCNIETIVQAFRSSNL